MADGPWTKYAQSSTPALAEDGPWSKYAPAQDSSNAAATPDNRNSFQKSVDTATAPPTQQEEAGHGGLHRAFDSFSSGASQGLLSPVAHPVEAMKSITEPTGFEGVIPGGSNPFTPIVINTAMGAYGDYKKNGLAHALGNLAGAWAGGEAIKAPFSETGLGEGMKSAGAKVIDNTVGLRKADVARGAQPGRAYLEGGGGPALTVRGIANKSADIAKRTGQELGDKYASATDAGTTIPGDRIANVLNAPIDKATSIKTGPGGTGGTSAFQEYRSSLDPLLQKANLTPSEVFAAKKNIAANTRWNDPTQFDLNKVRQMNVGGLGGELSDAVPGTAKLNKIYQGTTNLAKRAGERADTGQASIAQLGRRAFEGAAGGAIGHFTHSPLLAALPMALDTVPVKTSIARGLFVGGDAGRIAAPFAGVPGVARAKLKQGDEQKDRYEK